VDFQKWLVGLLSISGPWWSCHFPDLASLVISRDFAPGKSPKFQEGPLNGRFWNGGTSAEIGPGWTFVCPFLGTFASHLVIFRDFDSWSFRTLRSGNFSKVQKVIFRIMAFWRCIPECTVGSLSIPGTSFVGPGQFPGFGSWHFRDLLPELFTNSQSRFSTRRTSWRGIPELPGFSQESPRALPGLRVSHSPGAGPYSSGVFFKRRWLLSTLGSSTVFSVRELFSTQGALTSVHRVLFRLSFPIIGA